MMLQRTLAKYPVLAPYAAAVLALAALAAILQELLR
jgi:hypothetical protein